MCQKQIKLNAKEDVQEFVRAAGKCDFDIDVFYNRIWWNGTWKQWEKSVWERYIPVKNHASR